MVLEEPTEPAEEVLELAEIMPEPRVENREASLLVSRFDMSMRLAPRISSSTRRLIIQGLLGASNGAWLCCAQCHEGDTEDHLVFCFVCGLYQHKKYESLSRSNRCPRTQEKSPVFASILEFGQFSSAVTALHQRIGSTDWRRALGARCMSCGLDYVPGEPRYECKLYGDVCKATFCTRCFHVDAPL